MLMKSRKKTKIYNKPLKHLKKGNYFSKIRRKNPSVEEIARAKKLLHEIKTEKSEGLEELYYRSDTILLTDALLKYENNSIKTYDLDPWCFVSVPGCTYECNLYESKQEAENIRDEKLYLLVESGLRRGLIGVHGPCFS